MTNDTADTIEQVFRDYGEMTISQARERIHLHPERIRQHVKEPKYTPVGTVRNGRNPETVWKLNE